MSRHPIHITEPQPGSGKRYSLWHFSCLVVIGLLALLMVACAPGTGGTGTGPVTTGTDGVGGIDKPGVPPVPPVPPPVTGSPSTPPAISSTSSTLSQTLIFAAGGLAGGSPTPTTINYGGTSTVTESFADLGLCTRADFLYPTLFLSAQGIEYSQNCYRFSYTGEWSFGEGLTLSIKGTLINAGNPELKKAAVLTLVASSALSTENSVVKATLADETNLIKLPTEEMRFRQTRP